MPGAAGDGGAEGLLVGRDTAWWSLARIEVLNAVTYEGYQQAKKALVEEKDAG